MWKLVILVSFGLCACSSTLSPVAPGPKSVFERADGKALSSSEIDATVQSLMQAANVQGLGLALIDGSGVAYLKTYGHADIDEGRVLQADTIMYGASFTKALFAYMVMTLVDDGLIDLDKPIEAYLPKPLYEYDDFTDLANDQRWRVWTLRTLLSHTAGLPNWRWISETGQLEIIFEPNSRYAYSGEGIQIAQLTIEEALGLDANVLMQERIFDRFEMTRSSMLWREDFRPNFARGYSEQGENLGHNMRMSVRAAGSMDTTVADMAAFLSGSLNGDGLSANARAEMLHPHVEITAKHQFPSQFPEDTDANKAVGLSYGLGWGLFETPFGRAYFKEGHDDGTNNYAMCLDEAKRCLLLMANSSNGESIFLYLANALMGDTNLPWEWEGYVPYDKK